MNVILRKDYESLQRRLKELDTIQLHISKDIEEVLTQSSETWHDNAPFDSLIDKEKSLRAEQELLIQFLRYEVIDILSEYLCVDVGCRVCVHDGEKEIWYGIGGVYVDDTNYSYRVLSSTSLLGSHFLGLRVGDTCEVILPHQTKTFTVVNLHGTVSA